IRNAAFYTCTTLTNITSSSGVTKIQSYAFYGCSNLAGVFSAGNPPRPNDDSTVFLGDNNVTVYYLPGTTGWGATFDGRPAVLWDPVAESVGVQTDQFGFKI